MNRCFSCKNNRRQLLMLKCTHDVCIKCAADNFFVNCKNKLNPRNTRIVEFVSPRITTSARPVWSRPNSMARLRNCLKNILWITYIQRISTGTAVLMQE